jgi:hypothetical protein
MRRALLLLILAMLLSTMLSCAGYGWLLHTQIIAPPPIYAHLDHYTVRSVILPRTPCDLVRACDPSEPEIQHFPMSYVVWLVIDDSIPIPRRRMIRLVQLPLAAPQKETR